MSFQVMDVARYIINYCTEQGKPVSNLKLQKMLYYLWIDYYKNTNEYLFDETKDTKQEILDIKNLLNTADTAVLYSLADEELKHNSPFVFTALEYTENEPLVRNLLNSSNPALVLKSLEVLKMLDTLTAQDKETALSGISDENLRAVINAI